MGLNPKPGRAGVYESLLNKISSDGDVNLDTLFLSDSYGPAQLCVRKSQITGAGLGLVSMSRIEEGEEIFWKEQLCFVADNHLRVTCDNCLQWMGRSINATGRISGIGRSGLEVKSCAGCKVMSYCSKDCQRNAWRAYHKYECKLLANQHLKLLPRALIRLLCRRANSSLSDQQWDAIQKLGSHLDFYRDASDKWDEIVLWSKRVKELLGSSESNEDIQSLYCRILLNCMGLDLLEFEVVGIALDPLASLMNHSCDPNAVCLFNGTTLRVRSLQPILPGQEILISYTDNTMDRDVRCRILKSKWFFTCQCTQCLAERQSDTPTMDPARFVDPKIKSQLMFIGGSIDMLRKPEDGESAISKACRSTSWGEVWPAHIQPMPYLRFQLARGYLANENWIEALRHLLPVCLVSDPVIYGVRPHPVRVGRLYMLLCILSRVMEQEQRGGPEAPTCLTGVGLPMIYKYYLLRLIEHVSKSHGDSSTLAEAARYRRQKLSLASPMMGPLKEMAREAQCKLLTWAGIPESAAL